MRSAILSLLLLLTACVRVQYVPPTVRSPNAASAAAVVVRSGCAEDAPVPTGFPIEWRPGRAGTGVMLSPTRVLTALHVVDCPILPAVRVITADGQEWPMLVIQEDRGHDLAELELATGGVIDASVVPPLIGRPEGADVLCSYSAWPVAVGRCGPYEGRLTLGFTSVRGNSGSGVYDETGVLVGIVTRSDPKLNMTEFTLLDVRWLRGL